MKISTSVSASARSEEADDFSALGLADDFFRAAAEFAAMQQEHLAALSAGNGKDLFPLRQGRERAFRELARMLERMVVCGQEGNQEVIVARAREMVAKLLAEEGGLQELVTARQVRMQEQLLVMRKGKEALQGYSVNKGLVPRPSYLSSRM